MLPDADGGVWLLELNCPPCLGAYQGKLDEKLAESNPLERAIAALVVPMMRDLLAKFVLRPLRHPQVGGADVCASDATAESDEDAFIPMCVPQSPTILRGDHDADAFNALSWATHKWKSRRRAK